MFLGLDLGTSAVKAVLMDAAGATLAQASALLALAARAPHWREQSPDDWLHAAGQAIHHLRQTHSLDGVQGIGLAGQMHGAVLLDAADRVLRPAILWNDGRSSAECAALMQAEPDLARITGNVAMPGFTAPKLAWVRAHEPDIFARINRVLLPKDFLRLHMTGEAISDMSDASGTLWLDTGARAWSHAMLQATGLSERQMPALAEGSQPAGRLRPDIAAAWGLPSGCVLAGGGGDNAAAAVGLGCIQPGSGFVSLGTSGVIFVVDPRYQPAPTLGVHCFCHALPGRWHRMAVILTAARALAWFATLQGGLAEGDLLAELAAAPDEIWDGEEIFLPYLSGERTPHNNADARGVFFGLSERTSRANLTRAVLEGVVFALADGADALWPDGTARPALSATGGGAASALWLRLLSSVIGTTLLTTPGAPPGPALGASRLAAVATGAWTEADISPPPHQTEIAPDATLAARLAPRRARFRALYPTLARHFTAPEHPFLRQGAC
jgi:xylulokinase